MSPVLKLYIIFSVIEFRALLFTDTRKTGNLHPVYVNVYNIARTLSNNCLIEFVQIFLVVYEVNHMFYA